jgi:pilus assembly protein CpaF
MRVWFNRIHDSRRTLVEVEGNEVTIGRDPSNTIVLNSPLVSRRHVIVRLQDGKLILENIGLNSCMVGEEEILGGQSAVFEPGTKVRIWPFTLTFEAEKPAIISRSELEAHLRSVFADLELKIHRKLLERLDLYEFEAQRKPDANTILLLENHIEDICRELGVFSPENDLILEELAGLAIRDLLVQQILMDSGEPSFFEGAALAPTQFDIPATLVPERETEIQALLQFVRDRLGISRYQDTTERVSQVEQHFHEVLPLLRPHLHRELRRYLVLRVLKKDLKDTIFGYGPLEDLLRAPTITEIMVVSSDQIYIERNGVIERSGRRFISDKVTEAIIERIVAQVGRRIDKSQPLVDARLPDGSRVNAIIPPLAVKGPCLTIRKFPVQRFTIEDMIEMGTLTPAAAAFLRACVVDRRSILVSGGTGTGKTTMLNVLSSFIPNRERIITIEDTCELRLHQEHVVSLETKMASVEGTGAYTIRDLVRNALRMRPDRIIVGECRGPEALDMIQAMNTGHEGSMTTVHANSAREVIERLEVLILMAAELPISSIHRQIASAIDLIVHLSRLPGGKRVVSQITEVARFDPELQQIVLLDIFNFRDGKSLRPTGYLPSFIDSLVDKGLLDPRFLYGEQRIEEEERDRDRADFRQRRTPRPHPIG